MNSRLAAGAFSDYNLLIDTSERNRIYQLMTFGYLQKELAESVHAGASKAF